MDLSVALLLLLPSWCAKLGHVVDGQQHALWSQVSQLFLVLNFLSLYPNKSFWALGLERHGKVSKIFCAQGFRICYENSEHVPCIHVGRRMLLLVFSLNNLQYKNVLKD
jgi:hypothetical protein